MNQNLHHNRAVIRLGLLLRVLGRLGHQRVQALGRDRHDHHEDDQQTRRTSIIGVTLMSDE